MNFDHIAEIVVTKTSRTANDKVEKYFVPVSKILSIRTYEQGFACFVCVTLVNGTCIKGSTKHRSAVEDFVGNYRKVLTGDYYPTDEIPVTICLDSPTYCNGDIDL